MIYSPWWEENNQLSNWWRGSLTYLYKKPCVSIYWHTHRHRSEELSEFCFSNFGVAKNFFVLRSSSRLNKYMVGGIYNSTSYYFIAFYFIYNAYNEVFDEFKSAGIRGSRWWENCWNFFRPPDKSMSCQYAVGQDHTTCESLWQIRAETGVQRRQMRPSRLKNFFYSWFFFFSRKS
jgi:hypothetical protein